MSRQTALAIEEKPPYPLWYYRPRDETERRFREFHESNRFVYRELEGRVLEMVDAGAKRVGVRRAWEAMRWSMDLRAIREGREPYKLNDHFAPLYSRLLIHRNPRLVDVIETRGPR